MPHGGQAEDGERELREHVDERERPHEIHARGLRQDPSEAKDGDHAHADQLGGAPAHLADVADRGLRIARDEERREQRDDEQVEQDRPADDEARQVAEGPPHDQWRAAAGCRRSLGVGAGGEQDEQADDRQDDRREAERVQRHHAEREVERRGDRAVDRREERVLADDPLDHGQLARHYSRLPICSASQPRPRPASVSAAPNT